MWGPCLPLLPLAKYYKPTNEGLEWAIEVDRKLQQLHDVALKVTTKVQWKGQMARFGGFQNMSPKMPNLEYGYILGIELFPTGCWCMWPPFGHFQLQRRVPPSNRIWKCGIHLASVISRLRIGDQMQWEILKVVSGQREDHTGPLWYCVNIMGDLFGAILQSNCNTCVFEALVCIHNHESCRIARQEIGARLRGVVHIKLPDTSTYKANSDA